MRTCTAIGFAFVVAAVSACSTPLDAPGAATTCNVTADCAAGSSCANGICVAPVPFGGGGGSCTTDIDCGAGSGAVCSNGSCAAPSVSDDGSCGSTRDCAIDDFCDAGTCAPLPAGLCRSDAQCAGTNAPLCNAEAGRVDRCVMCRDDGDCDSGECFDNGTCAPPAPTSTSCPPNSSPLAGTTTCQCNAGFQPNASGACVAVDDEAPPTVQCVPHASPNPAVPGQCRCDAGFEPSTSAAECVVAGSQPSTGGGSTPPPSGGSGSGGSSGGGSGADDGCGDNAFPLFFLCVCFPGYVVDPSGAPGCIEDTASSTPPDEPAPTLPPDEEPPPDETDPGSDPGSFDDGCPEFSSPDPTDDAFCLCDSGYVVNDAGDACEEDMCATLGYYGDAEFCDDFCPLPDPDCTSGI